MDVAFVALDPERIGDAVDDGMITDLGDNVLAYKTDFTVNDRLHEPGEHEDEDAQVGDESSDESSDDNSSNENRDDSSSSDGEDEAAVELTRGKTNSLNTLIKFLSYDDVHE